MARDITYIYEAEYTAGPMKGQVQVGSIKAANDRDAKRQLKRIDLHPISLITRNEYKGPIPKDHIKKSSSATNETTKKAGEALTLMERIEKARASRGLAPEELERLARGGKGQKSVKDLINEYKKQHPEEFSESTEQGAAATTLYNEAKVIAKRAVRAKGAEAKRLYSRLMFIHDVVRETQGDQSPVAKKLEEIIKPVESALKEKTTFGAFVKEKLSTFKKSLPERLAGEIPVIGEFLSEHLREKREAREELEDYTKDIQDEIEARKAMGGKDFSREDIPREYLKGKGKEAKKSKTETMLEKMGGKPAAAIFRGLGGGETDPKKNPLGAIYSEAVKIREILEEHFKTDEEKAKDAKRKEMWKKVQNAAMGIFGLGGEKAAGGEGGEGGAGSAVENAVENAFIEQGGKGIWNTVKGFFGGGGGAAAEGGAAVAEGGVAAAEGGAVAAEAAAGAAGAAEAGGALAAASTAATTAGVALAGTAIGTAAAYGINKGIDALTGAREGEGLADYQMQASTYNPLEILDVTNYTTSTSAPSASDIEAGKKRYELTPEMKRLQEEYDRTHPNGETSGTIVNTNENTTAINGNTNAIIIPSSEGNTIAGQTVSQVIPSDGTISGSIIPSSTNTNVGGKTVSQLSAERDAVEQARQEANTIIPAATSAGTTNNISNKTSMVTNNYNDDLKIRNNEPTLRQMQRQSVMV